MADLRFRNIVNGESVDAADGATYDLVNPATGEVYAAAPASKAEDVDRAMQAADKAFEAWGDTTPAERQKALLKIADALEARADEFVKVESENTGKPLALTDERGDAAGGGPDPVLRRRRAGARGPVGRRVHEGPHVLRPPRADRRRRPGDAVELPADDDGLEDRAGAGRRQHASCSSRRTPRRPRRRCSPRCARSSCRPGVFNVVCGDRDTGRALVEHPMPQLVSITGSVRAGMEVAGSAAKQLKRAHLELGGKAPVIVFDDADVGRPPPRHRGGGLLQRRPGLHRGHPGARRARACTRTSSPR